MIRVLQLAAAGNLFVAMAAGRSPTFLAADVHVNTATTPNTRPLVARGEVLEARNVTMGDLVAFAYNSNLTKVMGGPSWLEMDRFDVTAKMPPQTSVEQQKLMLQGLLAERFKLVAHEETRPMPNFALTAPGKHKMKEGDAAGEPGCKPQSSNAPSGANGASAPGTLRILMGNAEGGQPVELTLTDGMIEYRCRNMTMTAFVNGMRGMLAPNLGVNPIVDQTNLSGVWNFDLRYSIGLITLNGAGSGDQTTFFDAVEKQMGLKLVEKPVPTQVVVVESVNQKPIANPAGTAEALPKVFAPKEFDVATIKPTSPDVKLSRFQMQPGGRLSSEGMPLTFLIQRAFNPGIAAQVADIPSWAGSARFDVVAQVSVEGTQALDPETIGAPMLALLKERFGLKYHTEQRELPAYDLVAGKPKMTKADPASRSWCKAPAQIPGAAPAPQGSQALICQNVTMAQFATLLRGRTPDVQIVPRDMTGLTGSWDFRLTFNPVIGLLQQARASAEGAATAAGAAGPAALSASDPIAGISLFDALDKQLGLKLEKSKRTLEVTVIDHIDQTPSDN